jgi:hypothetical protein
MQRVYQNTYPHNMEQAHQFFFVLFSISSVGC